MSTGIQKEKKAYLVASIDVTFVDYINGFHYFHSDVNLREIQSVLTQTYGGTCREKFKGIIKK